MWGTHWKTFSPPLVRSLDGFPEATVGSCLATSHVLYPCIYHKKPSDRQMCSWGQFNRNARIPHSTLLLHGSSLWCPLLSPRWDLAFIPPPQINDNIPHKNTARLHNQVLRHPQAHTPSPICAPCLLLGDERWITKQELGTTQCKNKTRIQKDIKHLFFTEFYRIKQGFLPVHLVSCQERCYLSRGEGDRLGSRWLTLPWRWTEALSWAGGKKAHFLPKLWLGGEASNYHSNLRDENVTL